jgi:large subunit ribosomal protein L21
MMEIFKRLKRPKVNAATVEVGGTQHVVRPGRFYDVNYIPGEIGDIITLDKVLDIKSDPSTSTSVISVGKPYLKSIKIYAVLLKHFRSRKTIVYKMRPKKKTRKKQGHRRDLTRLKVLGID